MKCNFTPFEVYQVAKALYDESYSHHSNKKIQHFIEDAVLLLRDSQFQIEEVNVAHRDKTT